MCKSLVPLCKSVSKASDFPGSPDGKESTCIVGNLGSVPGLERFPGEENGYPFQYSCLDIGQRSLVGYSPWGHKESESTEWFSLSQKYVPRVVLPTGDIQLIISHSFPKWLCYVLSYSVISNTCTSWIYRSSIVWWEYPLSFATLDIAWLFDFLKNWWF